MPENESQTPDFYWRLIRFEGARRAQLPLEKILLAIEEMEEVAQMLDTTPTGSATTIKRSEIKNEPAVDIPTGLGKTSVMATRCLALKAGASSPRRPVYAVNRRAVVHQATTVADEMKIRSADERWQVNICEDNM